MARSRPTLHILPIVKWRRGGHQTYRAAQLELVSILDNLLDEPRDGMLNGGVLLDGQTLILNDYLELRPEAQRDLREAIKSHRIIIGPWHVPPAEFIVQGEAIIRNLAAAKHQVVESATLLNIAMLPQAIGHIGQMPQILQEFGIEAVASDEDLNEPAAIWEAPNGSNLGVIRLVNTGASSPLELVEEVQSLLLAKNDEISDQVVLFQVANTPWSAELSTVIESTQRATRSMHLKVGSLPDYVSKLRTNKHLPHIKGEIRFQEPESQSLGILSARGWLKQRNHAVETLLLRWAEPFCAWADWLRSNSQTSFPTRATSPLLNFAWKNLLTNHAPEMIGGAHLDETTHEIALRIQAAEQIAEIATHDSLNAIAQHIDTSSLSHKATLPIIIFNAALAPTTDAVSFYVSLPESALPFEVIDENGNLKSFQVESIGELDPSGNIPVQLSMTADQIPSVGYSVYGLHPTKTSLPIVEEDEDTSIENESLNITMSPADGTLTIFDKRTGRSFAGLNHFIDGGDAGDLNSYSAPARDTSIDIATNTPLQVIRRMGAVEQRLETFQIYRVPRSLVDEGDARLPFTAQFVPISIWTTISLKRGVPRVDFEVLVSNAALDHRLRAHFPTGIYADEAYFDSAFEVVKRTIESSSVFPQQNFVTVLGESSGFTLANRGLREIEFLKTDQGLELALTLLRCVGTLRDPSSKSVKPTPEAQCIGDFSFAYSIIPHDVDPLPAWQQALAFQTPLRAIQAPTGKGTLPMRGGLVESDNQWFVISSIRWAESPHKGVIIRGYNMSDQPQSVTLALPSRAHSTMRLRLDDEPIEKPQKAGQRRLSFVAQPHEIVSYLVTLRA